MIALMHPRTLEEAVKVIVSAAGSDIPELTHIIIGNDRTVKIRPVKSDPGKTHDARIRVYTDPANISRGCTGSIHLLSINFPHHEYYDGDGYHSCEIIKSQEYYDLFGAIGGVAGMGEFSSPSRVLFEHYESVENALTKALMTPLIAPPDSG